MLENTLPKNDGPKNDGPKNDGPNNDGPKNDGPKNDGPKNDGPRNNRPKANKPHNPYARAKWLALASMVGLATLLNMVLRDWIASLHLAVVIVFTAITVGFAVHTLIVAIANRSRRNDEDPGESGGGHGGPDEPRRGPIDPELADPLRYQDDFGLAA